MSAGWIVGIFCIFMALLILLIIKFKVHAALALLVTVLFMGVALGLGWTETITLITTGFGNVMASIGIVIFLGVIIAVGLQETGAAVSINNFFSRLLGDKNLPLAAGLTSFILSIPVFGDITAILMAPIASSISYAKKISMKHLGASVMVGATMTHALVPPTPGILAASIALGADVGKVIFLGLLIGIPAYLINYFLFFRLRIMDVFEYVEPRGDFTEALVLREKEERPIPGTFWSLSPILVPVLLITLASFVTAFAPESAIAPITTVLGDRIIAMGIGVAIITFYALYRKDVIPKLEAGKTYSEMIFGDWVGRAITMAALPLIITSMAGPFGAIVQATGIAEKFTEVVQGAGIPLIIVPFVLALILNAVGGSATLAVMTSAMLAAPIVPQIGLSPEVVALVCGIGSITIFLPNQSLFWIYPSLFNLNVKQTFQTISIPLFFSSILCLLLLALYVVLGIA